MGTRFNLSWVSLMLRTLTVRSQCRRPVTLSRDVANCIDVGSSHAARFVTSTTAALAAAAESTRRYRELTAPPPPPPNTYMPPSPCHRCVTRPPNRPRLHSSKTQRLLMLGLGSELGVEFRVGGRAVNLQRKMSCQRTRYPNLSCALEARESDDRCISPQMTLPAHAVQKQVSSEGVIAARDDLRQPTRLVPRVMPINVVRLVGGQFGACTAGLREYAGTKLPHISPRLLSALSSQCACECALRTLSKCMSMSRVGEGTCRIAAKSLPVDDRCS